MAGSLVDLIDATTGRVFWAQPKRAAVSHDRAAVKVCGACNGRVAFVRSVRTGKWFLCDVFRLGGGAGAPVFEYDYARPHYKFCDDYRRMDQNNAAAVARFVERMERDGSAGEQ